MVAGHTHCHTHCHNRPLVEEDHSRRPVGEDDFHNRRPVGGLVAARANKGDGAHNRCHCWQAHRQNGAGKLAGCLGFVEGLVADFEGHKRVGLGHKLPDELKPHQQEVKQAVVAKPMGELEGAESQVAWKWERPPAL